MKRRTTAAKRKPTTRRRTPAKKNNLRPLIIGAAVIGGGYLAYEFLIKPMLNKNGETDENLPPMDPAATLPPATPPAATLTTLIQTVTNLPAGTVKIDPNKVIKPGDPASPELKASKQAFNDLIFISNKTRYIYNPLTMKISRDRIEAIGNLSKDLAGTGGALDTSTGYGEFSQKVANVILGKKTFTLNDVRAQRGAYYVALGLDNPYK